MTDVYIEINGAEHFAGPLVPEQLNGIRTSVEISHEALDTIRAAGAYYIHDHDKILIYGVDGEYSSDEIADLVADPWQVFKPAANEPSRKTEQ